MRRDEITQIVRKFREKMCLSAQKGFWRYCLEHTFPKDLINAIICIIF